MEDQTPLPTPVLTLSPNIQVRPYHPTDAPSLSTQGNNRAIWDNLRNRMPHPYTEAQALDWITHCNDPANAVATGPYTPPNPTATSDTPITSDALPRVEGSGPKIPVNFAILVSGVPAGSIGLTFNLSTDVYAHNAEIGYWLGQEYWGQGIMKAVVPAFVDWAWRTFGVLVRLEAEVEERNVGSRRVLEAAGFKVEGRREKGIVKNGVLRDVLDLGCLRPERERS